MFNIELHMYKEKMGSWFKVKGQRKFIEEDKISLN